MPNNFDGVAEQEAILTRLDGAADGGVFETLLDEEDAPTDAFGKVAPYIIALFGDTLQLSTDRTIGSDSEQPFVLPFSLVLVAPDSNALRALGGEIKNRFIDWRPTSTSDTIKTAGGMKPQIDAKNKPSRVTRMSHFTVDVNL